MNIEYWQKLVSSTVHLKSPDDAAAIAKACHAADNAGIQTSVWHEAAKFYGTKCNCRKCNA